MKMLRKEWHLISTSSELMAHSLWGSRPIALGKKSLLPSSGVSGGFGQRGAEIKIIIN